MESRIVLVRHGLPSIEGDIPSIDWSLSAPGKAAAIELAKYLSGFRVKEIRSSPEKKAHQTAALIADRLALPVCLDSDLREHDRSRVGYIARTDFEAGITRLLEHPHSSHLATKAQMRFSIEWTKPWPEREKPDRVAT